MSHLFLNLAAVSLSSPIRRLTPRENIQNFGRLNDVDVVLKLGFSLVFLLYYPVILP